MKAQAKAGHGEQLAGLLLKVAESLRGAPGCEIYVINQQAGDPDVVWVTEVWRSQGELDAALSATGDAEVSVQDVLALVDGPMERIDLIPLGGPGLD
jgi:quinol monooxygenase YgiN